VLPAGLQLRRRQGHADPLPTALAVVGEQRPPAAAEIEQPPSRPDSDPLGDVIVLAALRLLEGQREVAVELGAAEIGELAEAEPEDPVDQRVREIEVTAIGDRPNLSSRRGAGVAGASVSVVTALSAPPSRG